MKRKLNAKNVQNYSNADLDAILGVAPPKEKKKSKKDPLQV
jgi:hypothetical protein